MTSGQNVSNLSPLWNRGRNLLRKSQYSSFACRSLSTQQSNLVSCTLSKKFMDKQRFPADCKPPPLVLVGSTINFYCTISVNRARCEGKLSTEGLPNFQGVEGCTRRLAGLDANSSPARYPSSVLAPTLHHCIFAASVRVPAHGFILFGKRNLLRILHCARG